MLFGICEACIFAIEEEDALALVATDGFEEAEEEEAAEDDEEAEDEEGGGEEAEPAHVILPIIEDCEDDTFHCCICGRHLPSPRFGVPCMHCGELLCLPCHDVQGVRLCELCRPEVMDVMDSDEGDDIHMALDSGPPVIDVEDNDGEPAAMMDTD